MNQAARNLPAALLALATLASLPVQATAEAGLASEWAQLHAARVRLIAGAGPVAPGRSYVAGVEVVLADGWKTYWRMPGDAGVPPSFDWSGSTNVADVKVLYPAPARLPEAGGEAVGYKKAVIFPVQLTPKDAKQPVELKLAMEFGVCREICIPAEAALSLKIAPGKAGTLPAELANALERVPRAQAARRATDPELQRVTTTNTGNAPRLVVDARFPAGSKGADLFIEAPDGLFIKLPKVASEETSGAVRFVTDLSADLVRELKGKTLILTLVGSAGATEAQWTHP